MERTASLDYIRRMPKVELHAHLNGSVSQYTLKKITALKSGEEKGCLEDLTTHIESGHNSTYANCFEMFKDVQRIVDDHDSIYMATCDVIDEFAADGVVYLELRSTPRPIPAAGVTQKSYMETILRAIADKTSTFDNLSTYKPKEKPIIVRYIPSIDRRNSVDHASQTLKLTLELMKTSNLIVGIDLSGNSQVGDARDFIPVLGRARECGLKLALHLAEVDGFAEETSVMLDLPPDRIGHGTFIHPEFGGTQLLLQKTNSGRIPLELCLTSNIKGCVTPLAEAHHFRVWYEMGHPITICTDDKGVFATDLSDEYRFLADAFNLSHMDLEKLAQSSIDFTFLTDAEKGKLRDYFAQYLTFLSSHDSK